MSDGPSLTLQRLRERAEAKLGALNVPLEQPEDAEMRELLRELSLQRLELEMQQAHVKELEEELAASREKYRDLYDLAPVAYVTLDPEGRIRDANLTAYDLLGATPAALHGKPLSLYLQPADSELTSVLARMQRIQSDRDLASFRATLSRADGSRRICQTYWSVVIRETGQRQWRVVLVDISEEIAARAALEEEVLRREEALDEVHLRSLLLQSVTDAVISLDLEERVWGWNSGAERLYGLPSAEVVGRYLRDLDLNAGLAEAPSLQELLSTSDTWEGELAQQRRDGRELTVHASVSWIHDRRGERIGLVAVNRDVTARRRAERQAQEVAARLQQIAERIDAVLYVVDSASGRTPYISAAYQRVWGQPPEDEGGQPFDETIHPDDRLAVIEATRRVKEGEPASREYRIIRPDATVRWIRDRLYPELDEEGRIVRYLGIADDVTDTKRLEADLRQAQKLEAIGTLSSGIAHDFNNLMMGIAGFADIAINTLPEGSQARTYLDEVKKAALRGKTITRQLLNFTRKRDAEPSTIDVNLYLDEASEMLSRILGEDIELRLSLGAQGALVRCDPAELDQVLLNLTANARAAMPDGGRLTIATSDLLDRDALGTLANLGRGPFLALSVSDTGCGMDEETRRRVFDPFFTTKPPSEGTGLGLSSVYGIIKRLGGQISVHTELGEGSSFEVVLPSAGMQGESGATPPTPASEGEVGEGTVLVVEDDRLVRLSVRYYLQQAGYRVLEASDAAEALECSARFPREIDLLLTDMVLPGKSGQEIARLVRTERPTTRVVYLSAHPREELVQEGRIASNDWALQKPCGQNELLDLLRRALAVDA